MAADLVIMHQLETTDAKVCKDQRKSLVFLDWAVVREPLLLLEAAGFAMEGPYWQACISYIMSMFFGILTTLGLELGFNRMRDNESRGARHKVSGITHTKSQILI